MTETSDFTLSRQATRADALALRGRTLLVPQLVLAMDAERPTTLPVRFCLADVARIEIGRGQGRTWARAAGTLRIDVPDRTMSQLHATLRRESSGAWVLEDAGSKNGTFIGGALCERAVLAEGSLIELGHTFFLFKSALVRPSHEPEVVDLRNEKHVDAALHTLVPTLAAQFADAAKLAPSGVAVLLLGETGTGKERIARGIHAMSQRKGAFVAVNCGALPTTLVESELFGAKKGAFSGATEDRLGLVRTSDNGTLLLDEIGDLPLSAQAALLRVLQEREVMPVGGTKPVPVDLRVIAATHHDIEGLAAKKAFRSDLFARINGFCVRLPALADRMEDMGLIVANLLRAATGARAERVTFTNEAVRALYHHGWPHNVRELEKKLRTALVLAEDGGSQLSIDRRHLFEVTPAAPKARAFASVRPSRVAPPVDAEARERLVDQLREHQGNISAVARAMGKARMQIHRWIRQYGIELESFR